MNRPVILCGFGKVGQQVLECLRDDCVPVVVVDLKLPPNLPPAVQFIAGDCRHKSTLDSAGVGQARGVIICTSDELVNIATALAVRSIAPKVRIVVRAFNPRLVPRLGYAMADVIALSVSGLAAPMLAQLACTGNKLGTVAAPDGPRTIVELVVSSGSSLDGKSIGQAVQQALAIAYLPIAGKPRLLAEVTGNETITAGDRLVICGRPDEIAAVTGGEPPGADDDVRWAGWLKRQWRAVARTLGEVERPVQVAFAVLIALLTFSTIVYVLHGDPLATAFYHTVGIMATAGDLGAENQGSTFKTFVGILRLAGAALLAAFTAIFTNYLVRAKLGGALEARHIPDGGHVVVCGLGNVGFRLVEALVRTGQSVVIVESKGDNPFLATARQLGAATVIGSSTLVEALRHARVDTARSVVCATGNDLVNVESALQVRELRPEQRVIVRVSDADLAKALRESANIRFAVSIPALAAPAFAAALFGDRMEALFLVGNKPLTTVTIRVTADEVGLAGKTVQQLVEQFNLLPVSVQSAAGDVASNLMNHQLRVGDQLIAVIRPSDLDRFYRSAQKG